jgi:hypothetical protein
MLERMEALLQSWLDELRSDGLHLAAEDFAGANENLWCISVSADQPIAGPIYWLSYGTRL